jgi:hypothetical protein
VSDTDTISEFYKSFPELNTPIHHEFLKEFQQYNPEVMHIIDSANGVRLHVVDKEYLRDISIRSDYSGDDFEKTNFSQNAGELLGDKNLYYLDSESIGPSVAILTSEDREIKSLDELKKTLTNTAQYNQIPCYLDKTSGSFVIYLNHSPNFDDLVRHGERSATHRNTYQGVILARTLGGLTESPGTEVIVKSPNELMDDNIQPFDILNRNEIPVLNCTDNQLNPQLLNLLKHSGILTYTDYANILHQDASHHTTVMEVSEFQDNTSNNIEKVCQNLASDFKNFYEWKLDQSPNTGIVFSPGVLTGNFEKAAGSNTPDYLTPFNDQPDIKDGAVSILAAGGPITISLVAIKIYDGDSYLVVAGNNHFDAYHYLTAFTGFDQYEQRNIFAELDATLAIDIPTFVNKPSGKAESDLRYPYVVSINGIGNPDNCLCPSQLSPDHIQDAKDLDKFISHFNTVFEVYHNANDRGRMKFVSAISSSSPQSLSQSPESYPATP